MTRTDRELDEDKPFELPQSAYDLIDTLDRAYPPRCISLNETLESAHRYAGLRSLIDELVEMKRAEIEGHEEAAQDPL